MEEILIEGEFIKLDQLLKFSGLVDTGGQAKMIIRDGLVKVNGQVNLERGKKIYPNDLIEIEDYGKLKVKSQA